MTFVARASFIKPATPVVFWCSGSSSNIFILLLALVLDDVFSELFLYSTSFMSFHTVIGASVSVKLNISEAPATLDTTFLSLVSKTSLVIAAGHDAG
jgi:hypothetical protein